METNTSNTNTSGASAAEGRSAGSASKRPARSRTRTAPTRRTGTTKPRAKAAVKAAVKPSPTAAGTGTARTKTASPAAQLDARTVAFATIGAADLFVSSVREATERMATMTRDPKGMQVLSETLTASAITFVGELAARGEKFVAGIQDSDYAKRAMDQTEIARSQVKAAGTHLLKAVDSATVAAREAVKKVS